MKFVLIFLLTTHERRAVERQRRSGWGGVSKRGNAHVRDQIGEARLSFSNFPKKSTPKDSQPVDYSKTALTARLEPPKAARETVASTP